VFRQSFSWKRLVSLLAALLILSAQVRRLDCVMPGCLRPDSKSMTKCEGMNMADSAASLESLDRLPCCQMHHGLANTFIRTAILEAPSAVPAPALPHAASVGLLTPETRPVYRQEFSPPKLRSLLCILLI